MHPLTMDFSEQILALIRVHSYSLLGAIQDNKTVLGGSAGSGGGVGDPPAGFVGQLTQSNVTFDIDGPTRACSAGSSGSSSLVDNLDAIRLGTEICDDAIGDRHIDWGHGAGQVDAEDVPFTSGSLVSTNVHDAIEELLGQGGIKTIGQVVSVGVSGCNYTLPSLAVAYINGLGDAAANKPYLIWMMAGKFVEAADVIIPSHVDLVGQGEATILDMGDATLMMAADTSLRGIVVTSTADDNWYVLYLDEAHNAVVDDVRVIVTGTGGAQECVDIYNTNNFELYHVVCESTQTTNFGFYAYKSTGLLWDCKADDETNFDLAFWLGSAANPSTVTTKFCEFRASSVVGDVLIYANNVWNHFACQFDPNNCSIAGTEVMLPHRLAFVQAAVPNNPFIGMIWVDTT